MGDKALDGFIEATLGGDTAKGDNAACDCPQCGKQGHFYINRNTGLGFCQRCGYAVNLPRLIADVEGIRYHEAWRKAGSLLRKAARKEIQASSKSIVAALLECFVANREGPTETQEQRVALPKGCVPISAKKARQGRSYLRARGFTAAHWSPYGLLFSPRGPKTELTYWNHIIFPVLSSSGDLIYFTSRAAFEPKNGGRKARNPRVSRKNVLFGASAIPPDRNLCILVEGPLDAVALPAFGVALLGITCHEEQAAILLNRFSTIVVCLDTTAQDKALDTAKKLRRKGIEVRLSTSRRGKDPADGVSRDPMVNVMATLERAKPLTLLEEMRTRFSPWK